MTLIESRVKECFWLFGLILPINAQYKEKMTAAFGEDVAKIIPEILQTIATICNNNPDAFAGYLEFIGQSYDYCRGYSDNLPQVELDGAEYQEFIQKQLQKAKALQRD